MVDKSKLVVVTVVLVFLASLVGILYLSAIEDEPDADYSLEVVLDYNDGGNRLQYDIEGLYGYDDEVAYDGEMIKYVEELLTYEEGGYCSAADNSEESALKEELERVKDTLHKVREEKERLVALIAAQHDSVFVSDGRNETWEAVQGHQRVLMPTFPASGGPELMNLLSSVLGGPVCSVYPESGGRSWNAELTIEEDDIVECRCSTTSDCTVYDGAPAPISTYFPTITQQVAIPTVDKILLVVRNPVDNIEAFWRMCKETSWLASRRRAWKWHFENEIAEYKKFHDFWDRYAATVGVMFKAVKYEDLCRNPVATFDSIVSFLDAPRSRVDWTQVEAFHTDDFCISLTQSENGVHRYTEGQGGKIMSVLSSIIAKYEYGDIMEAYSVVWEGVPDE